MKNISIKEISKIGLFSALIIILSLSPLGFIPIGAIRITTIHIPIVIIAILEKPRISFFVGFIFGLFSFFQHLQGISTLSFIFINPFVSVLPRALIGVCAYYSYVFFKKHLNNTISLVLSSVVGTFINTFGVLFFAYIFCKNQIYEVLKIDPKKFLLSVALTNGIAEIIVCSIVAPIILKKLLSRKKSKNI